MAALGFILFAAGSRMSSLNSSSFLLASESEQPSSESFTDSKLHIISEELPFNYFIDTAPNQCLILFKDPLAL